VSEPQKLNLDEVDWSDFIERTAEQPNLPHFDKTLAIVGAEGHGRMVIDLGFGGGRDARVFLANGWRVFGVDVTPAAEKAMLDRVPDDQRERLEIAIGRFHEVDLPDADLVYASFSLPFAGQDFEATIDAALAALKPGGYFAGILFGMNDDWIADDVAGVTREWIVSRFEGMTIETIDETDEDGPYGGGQDTKHWHYYLVVARR